MNNYDAKRFRDELAGEIRLERDKNTRREILMAAKRIKEYELAKEAKQAVFTNSRKRKVETDSLLRYAQERYQSYSSLDADDTALNNTFRINYEEFYNQVLPNVPAELKDKIIAFIEGSRDSNLISLLKRVNFDYEGLLSGEKDKDAKITEILEIILKAWSYDEAVEQSQNHEIDFSGFEVDLDLTDAKAFISRVFSRELLQKCLISQVKYAPNTVAVPLGGTGYLLPLSIYQEWEQLYPEVKSRKVRARSSARWNTDPKFSKKFSPTPIYIYSFYGEQPELLNDT